MLVILILIWYTFFFPTKVGPTGKDQTRIPQWRTFESHYQCENLVGGWFVSTSVSAHWTFRHALTLVSPHDPTHLNFILIKYDTPFVFCVRVHARQGFKTEPDFLVQPGIGCMFGPKASENYSSIETVNNRENLWKLTSWMALLKAFLFFFFVKKMGQNDDILLCFFFLLFFLRASRTFRIVLLIRRS